jgi:hypothetical protein
MMGTNIDKRKFQYAFICVLVKHYEQNISSIKDHDSSTVDSVDRLIDDTCLVSDSHLN